MLHNHPHSREAHLTEREDEKLDNELEARELIASKQSPASLNV